MNYFVQEQSEKVGFENKAEEENDKISKVMDKKFSFPHHALWMLKHIITHYQ